MKAIQKYLILVLLLSLAVESQAQLDKEVVVRKLKQWKMTDANKINLLPQISDTSTFKPSFNYKITPYQYQTNFQPEAIRPAKMLPEPESFFYGNYIKLGFGSNISPYAEVRMNNTGRGKIQYSVMAKHHSAYAKFKKNQLFYYPGFNNNEIQLTGKKFLHTKRLKAHMGFTSKAFRYYGYDFENAVSEFPHDSLVSQSFNKLNAGFEMTSTSLRNNKTLLNTAFNFYALADKEKNKEQGAFIDFDYRDKYKNSKIFIASGFDYLHRATSSDTVTHMYIDINPSIQRDGEDWKFIIGVNSTIKIDPDDNVQTYFYPNIQFDYTLAKGFLTSYFAYTGNLEENFFNNLMQQNRFVVTQYDLRPTSCSKNIYAGFKGVFTSKLKYNFKASYREYKDAVLFAGKLYNDSYRFDVLHTNMDMAEVKAELFYLWKNKIQAHLTGNYYSFFTIEKEDYAWLKPDYQVNLNLRYNIQDKIWISSDLYNVGNRMAKKVEADGSYTAEELAAFYDFNLGIEYKYNKKVAAFLTFNNLLGSKYYLWNNYPVQGFHVMAGLSYAF